MASNHPSYTILFSCPEPISAGAVRVSYQRNRFGRLPHAGTEQLIDEYWGEALARNPRLFDGKKFRLHSALVLENRSNDLDAESYQVQLNLSLTGYRDYIGTHRRSAEEHTRLLEAGRQKKSTGVSLTNKASKGEKVSTAEDTHAHFSCALGVEALLVTADGKAVLLRRSNAVATNQGEYNGPSGHPEPANVLKRVETTNDGSGSISSTESKTVVVPPSGADSLSTNMCMESDEDFDDLGDANVKQEIFNSVIDETVAETGIPREALSDPLLLGAMRDARGKPDLLFSVFTTLSWRQVAALYEGGDVASENAETGHEETGDDASSNEERSNGDGKSSRKKQRPMEAWESDNLLFLPITELLRQHRKQRDGKSTNSTLHLTPVTQAALDCYSYAKR